MLGGSGGGLLFFEVIYQNISKFSMQKYSEAFFQAKKSPLTYPFQPTFSLQKCLRILLQLKFRHIAQILDTFHRKQTHFTYFDVQKYSEAFLHAIACQFSHLNQHLTV